MTALTLARDVVAGDDLLRRHLEGDRPQVDSHHAVDERDQKNQSRALQRRSAGRAGRSRRARIRAAIRTAENDHDHARGRRITTSTVSDCHSPPLPRLGAPASPGYHPACRPSDRLDPDSISRPGSVLAGRDRALHSAPLHEDWPLGRELWRTWPLAPTSSSSPVVDRQRRRACDDALHDERRRTRQGHRGRRTITTGDRDAEPHRPVLNEQKPCRGPGDSTPPEAEDPVRARRGPRPGRGRSRAPAAGTPATVTGRLRGAVERRAGGEISRRPRRAGSPRG